jgi:hypothetical protein
MSFGWEGIWLVDGWREGGRGDGRDRGTYGLC